MSDRDWNGRTVRTFTYRGVQLSEVEFILEDVGPAIGYMIGKDDGRSTLHPTADQAVDAWPFKDTSPTAQ